MSWFLCFQIKCMTKTNKYNIKIVSFDPEKFDLLRYPNIEQVGFKVGYLVYSDNKLTHTAWFKTQRQLFKSLDKFLNITT